MAILFAFTGVLAWIPCSNDVFFWISLGVVIFLTLTVTVLNMTITVEAAVFNMLPQICSGQGVAGVMTSIADITTTFIFSDGELFLFSRSIKLLLAIYSSIME